MIRQVVSGFLHSHDPIVAWFMDAWRRAAVDFLKDEPIIP